MRVLVVDDNEELRGFLALSLEESSMEVVATESAGEALRLVEAEKFDAIILDSSLPDGDGVALAQSIRASKNGQKTPILLMSNVSTSLIRRMAKMAGCNDVLVKPFSPMQFIDQVKSLR